LGEPAPGQLVYEVKIPFTESVAGPWSIDPDKKDTPRMICFKMFSPGR